MSSHRTNFITTFSSSGQPLLITMTKKQFLTGNFCGHCRLVMSPLNCRSRGHSGPDLILFWIYEGLQFQFDYHMSLKDISCRQDIEFDDV